MPRSSRTPRLSRTPRSSRTPRLSRTPRSSRTPRLSRGPRLSRTPRSSRTRRRVAICIFGVGFFGLPPLCAAARMVGGRSAGPRRALRRARRAMPTACPCRAPTAAHACGARRAGRSRRRRPESLLSGPSRPLARCGPIRGPVASESPSGVARAARSPSPRRPSTPHHALHPPANCPSQNVAAKTLLRWRMSIREFEAAIDAGNHRGWHYDCTLIAMRDFSQYSFVENSLHLYPISSYNYTSYKKHKPD